MPGLNIPGVTNRYNTNETVERLMEIERVPLTREQDALESYRTEQSAWRDVNRKLTEFRDSAKMLYSFENPFNNKLANSSNEAAVTAEAARGAAFQSFKVDVLQTAAADRFLSAELPENQSVPEGRYTFRVADKAITMNWRGGSLTEFSRALNRRGSDIVRSLVIGSGAGKRTLLIESLKTGEANRLIFEDDAKPFAVDIGMISPTVTERVNPIAVQSENFIAQTQTAQLQTTQTESFIPNNPASIAQDAIVKYEGITIRRPSNNIDNIVPDVTLHLHDRTERSATITIEPDIESSKDALITFVGKYNAALAEINILTQNKSEIIDELTYLSDEERSAAQERLGMFTGDFSLSSIKSSLQNIQNSRYAFVDGATVTSLAEIGISTSAAGGFTGYSAARLRGYLEIDETRLDRALESNMEDIKNLFGYDTDGDMIVDSGIAYRLDTELSAYVQTGGIIAMKQGALDTRIQSTESRISRLETQLANKERELRQRFTAMEGALNSLESQQNSISNFTRQQNRNNE